MPGKGKKNGSKAASGEHNGMKTYADKYAPTTWGRPGVFDVTVPSGQLVQVQRLGPTALVKSGLLSKVDILSGIVESEHIGRVSGRNVGEDGKKLNKAERKAREEAEQRENVRKLAEDPKQLLEAMAMMDEITCLVVLQPKITPVPVPREPTEQDLEDYPDLETDDEGLWIPPRKPGLIYVDTVDDEDKIFLFQYVMGGSDDLKSFRTKLDEGMADLEPGEDVQDATE